MAHAQKPDFVFRRNGRVHLNRWWASVQSTTGSRGVCISGSNAGYTMFRGSVKSTGYTLHSTVSPSLPLPCVTLCHHIVIGLYYDVPIVLQYHVFPLTILAKENRCAWRETHSLTPLCQRYIHKRLPHDQKRASVFKKWVKKTELLN